MWEGENPLPLLHPRRRSAQESPCLAVSHSYRMVDISLTFLSRSTSVLPRQGTSQATSAIPSTNDSLPLAIIFKSPLGLFHLPPAPTTGCSPSSGGAEETPSSRTGIGSNARPTRREAAQGRRCQSRRTEEKVGQDRASSTCPWKAIFGGRHRHCVRIGVRVGADPPGRPGG